MADKSDKTEQPTAKKLSQARKEGQVAKTPELAAWLSVLVAAYLAPVLLGQVGRSVESVFLSLRDVFVDPSPERMLNLLGGAMRGLFLALLPVLLAFMVLAVVADLVQIGGLRFATKAAKPSGKRLNPIAGFKRLFSTRSLWDLGKNVVKVTVIAYLAFPLVVDTVRTMIAVGIVPIGQVIDLVGDDALALVKRVAAVGLLVAVADFGYQKRRTRKDLMMSKQEVKDEAKQADANPEVKAKIKGKMYAASRNRMLAAVKEADVVVVNPVHIAVALRYEALRGAPRVVAKGRDLLAERIKDEAEGASVPIVESVPLARALYAACEIDDEIPVQLYEAVARLLAFVQRLGRRAPLVGSIHRLPDALAPR